MTNWIFFNDLAIDIDLVKSFHIGSSKYCDPLKFIKFNYIDGSELSWSFYSYEEAQKAFNSLTKQIAISTQDADYESSQEKSAIKAFKWTPTETHSKG